MGFSDVQVAENAIYAVFHGRSFKEIVKSAQAGVDLPDDGQFIYVFNLKGDPICKYVLDDYIYGIFVDEKKVLLLL